MSNFYDVLGVSKEADDQEIKKAFRKLSLQYHPDRNQDGDTTAKFQEINAAFEALKTPELRQQYNDGQASPFNGGGRGGMPPGMHPFGGMPGMGHHMHPGHPHMSAHMGGEDFGDINQFFNMMFGGGMPPGMGGMGGMPGMPGVRIFHNGGHTFFQQQHPQHHQKPPPIQCTVEITLQQAYMGCSVPLDFERWVLENDNNRRGERESMFITIPPGIDENETIRIHDRGNIVNEHVKGDIHVNVKITNNTPFQRQGLDLLFKKTITLHEALCGFAFDLQHLNGKTMSINNKNNVTIIHPNFRRVVPGIGMKKDAMLGNMIIEFNVEFPSSLTPEQVAALDRAFRGSA